MDPTTDPETPAESEEPMDVEGGSTVDSAEVNADEETYTVSIADFESVSAFITADATVGETRDKSFSKTGSLTADKGANVVVTISAKSGTKITAVKNGETAQSPAGDGSYSISLSSLAADAEITVEAAAAYKLTTEFGDSGVTQLALDKSLKDAIGAANDTTAMQITTAEVAQGEDLKFTLVGAAAGDAARYNVSYKANGSDEETPITAVPEAVSEAEGAEKVDTYTVKKEDLADFHSIVICVEKEAKVDLGAMFDAVTNTDVSIVYWGTRKASVTEGDASAWVEGDNAGKYDAITKAYVGETFKFKAVVKDTVKNKAVTKVTMTVGGKDETISLADGAYSFTVKANTTAFAIETDYTTEATNQLTYTLKDTCDEDSVASAAITKITVGTTEKTTPADIKALLGGKDPSDVLKSGSAVTVKKAEGEEEITAIEVTITPAENYAIKKVAADTNVTINETSGVATYKFTKVAAADSKAISADMKIDVETEVKATEAENATFFKVTCDKTANTHIKEVKVTETTKVTKVLDTDNTTVKAYKIADGVQTVEFKVTAEAGYTLTNPSSYTGYKSVKEEAAADGKTVTYTVTLFASKIKGANADAPTEITVEEKAVLLSAEVKAATEDSTGNYAEPTIKYFTKEDPDTENVYSSGETIPYGSKLTTTITPANGCHLVTVSYNMAGKDTPVTLNNDGEAEVTVPEVIAKVTINVTAEKDYEKTDLTKAVDYNGEAPSKDSEGVYSVRYDGKYLVGLTNGGTDVPAKEFKAVVKDENGTEVTLPRIVTGTKLKIDLTRAKTSVAGQVITIDMVVGDKVVDTYILNVNKKTSKLTIDGVTKATKEQRVDSKVEYVIDTDGDLSTMNIAVWPDDGSIIEGRPTFIGNKLVVTTAAKTTTQITKTAATATAPAVYHSATITLTSDDDPDLEASLVVTAQPFIEDITEKEITLQAGDKADTVLNVTLGLGDVATPESGSLYYELTVTPKPTGSLDTKLLSAAEIATELATPAYTQKLVKKGGSQNIQVQVAKSPNLGMGAACDYEVKAKLTYKVDESHKESTKEMISTDFATIDGKEIKYENNLKLTKDSSFKGTLYTGQSGEIVIANTKWSTKNVNYKILSGDIFDSVKYDKDGRELSTLSVGQNASGQIVVTNVPEDTYLGKHTITVVATADESEGHEMYKSRATITVNVVKGIEEGGFTITPASNQIYKKDARSKATLKMTAAFDRQSNSWDGKKYVDTPKSKSLKWTLVGADSYENNENALPDSFGGKAVFINEKNGTITVDKKFVVSKNKANNRFCVKATAADYTGNTAVAYSETIEITSNELGIAKLALVKYNSSESKYEVVAVQNADKEEIKLDATVVDDATVYALPTGVELTKEYTVVNWNKVKGKLISMSNYSVTSSSKKVVEVRSNKSLNVLTAGKTVKLTVTANDGSKQKRTLPLNLGWTGVTNDMALQITSYDSDTRGDVFNPTKEYKSQTDKAAIQVKPITSTGAVRFRIDLMEGNKPEGASNDFDYADGFTNYKLAVKGGKLTRNGYGYAELVTTSNVTTLTLTIGTGRDAKKSVYTITNNAYDKTAKGKAPKVTVKGSLHENGHKGEQQVPMTVLNGKELFGKKLAKVEIDWSSMNAKNESTLNGLDEALAEHVIALDEKTGAMTLSFKAFDEENDEYDSLGFTPGNYKLKVTVGTGTAAKFTPETLPATVTLKVVKNKTFTFKPQTTYTIGKLDGGAILTGKSNVAKGEKTFMNFYNLRNANVNGRPNDFTHYFTIDYDPINNTQRLVLNTDDAVFKEKFGITAQAPLDWDAIDLTKIDKKDLTGYVSYDARASKKYYGVGTTGWANYAEGTVKITVKLAANPKNGVLKPSLKYTANKAEVLAKDNEKAVFNVMSGSEYVTVGAAVIYETDQLKADVINEKGQVLVAVKGVAPKRTYNTTMKIVPYSSPFMGAIDAVKADKEKYQAAIEKYGILVKVSVVTKETAAEVTATPDPVTTSAAVNLINAKTETTGWTTKLIVADSAATTAEKTTAKNAIAKEVGDYLKSLAKAYETGFTVKANKLMVAEDGNTAVVYLTVEKGSDVEYFTIDLDVQEGGAVTPPTPTSKTPAEAVSLINSSHAGNWTDDSGDEIKVILSSDGSSVQNDGVTALVAAVQKWINEQDGYSGFTVAQKTSTTVGTDGKVTLTISKTDETDADIEITLNTEQSS